MGDLYSIEQMAEALNTTPRAVRECWALGQMPHPNGHDRETGFPLWNAASVEAAKNSPALLAELKRRAGRDAIFLDRVRGE